MASLVSPADFVAGLSHLDYHERIQKAREFGRDHAKEAELTGWLQEMRKHPDPVAPQVPEEKGFTDILPPQKLNIAKYYDQDQYAVAAAIASKSQTDLLVAELSSPSKWFQTKAAKAVVRQVKDDALLEKQCLSSTKAVRKKLLHALIREKKVALLEKLYPSLYTQKGPEFAIDILHGCSSGFVKARFAEDPLLIDSPHLDWKKLGQFHGVLLMTLLEEELKSVHFVLRQPIWTKWSPRFLDAFFFKAHHGKALWNLWVKYPAWTHRWLAEYDATKIAEKDFEVIFYSLNWPLVITSRARHYLAVAPAECFAFFKYSSGYNAKYKTFVINTPISTFFNAPHTPAFLPQIIDLYKYWHKINPERFAHGYLMLNDVNTLATYLSAAQLTSLAELGFKLYDGYLENSTISYYIQRFVQTIYTKIYEIQAQNNSRLTSAINFTGDEQQEKMYQNRRAHFNAAHIKLVKATLKAIVSTFDAQFPTYVNYIIPKATFPVTSVDTLLDGIKPWLDKVDVALANRNDFWVYDWDVKFSALGTKLFGVACLNQPGRKFPDTFLTEAEVATAKAVEKRLIDTFYAYWATDPIKQAENLYNTYFSVDQKLADELYKCFGSDHVNHLLSVDQSKILNIWSLLPHTTYQDHLNAALTDEKTSDKIKEDLQGYRNVVDHAVRKELEKATDSNSEPQRKAGIKNLVDATFRTRDVVQLKRTLNFLRNKLKNEQITMRIAGIQSLLGNISHIIPTTSYNINWTTRPTTDGEAQLLFPEGVTDEILETYNNLLQDALEVRDLDLTPKDDEGEGGGIKLQPSQLVPAQHPLLKYFLILSQRALLVGASNPTGPVFKFGVELQWRIQSFRAGPKLINKTFSIELPQAFQYIHKGGEATRYFKRKDKEGLFAAVVDEMESRVGAKNKEWRESYDWKDLFWIVNNDWDRLPSVVAFLKAQLAAADTKRDVASGICLVEGNSLLCRVFEFILNLQKKQAYGKPLVGEYFNLLLNSYQARSVVFQWLKARENGLKRKAQKQQRDKSVKELLALSKSAIHLRFVWRHLLNWSTSQITPFLNAADPFRGIFYVEPSQRKIRQPKEEVKKPAGRKPARGRRVVEQAPKLKELSGAPKDTITGIKEHIKKNTKADKRMKKDLEETKRDDHEDYFFIPGCYGLQKLLPSQAELLAKKWVSIANNSDRDIPFRTVACKRFTLVPTVNYADIVAYVEANPKFAVNLLEALLQGTIYNDEPLAPLNYLLSPEFLSSDRARVAAYAVCAAVKFLKSVGITDIVSLVLSGKRREGLKVTAYKEMIRLLASIPTSKHISMIQTEWRRKELHRDVRIAIIKAAYLFLYKNTEKGIKVAWEILLDAVSLQKQEEWKYSHELIIALLGASPIIPRDSHGISENLFLKPLLFEFFQSTTKCKIPAGHCERFANEIVLPLSTTALVDDVKTIAIFSLVLYKTLGDFSSKAADILYALMADEKNNLLNSIKPSDQGVFDYRWRHAGLHMCKLTASNGDWVPSGVAREKAASRDYITKILRRTVDRINGYRIDERRKRIHMVANLEHFIALLPHSGPYSLWDWDQENQFLTPLKEIPFFWQWLTERFNNQLADKWYSPFDGWEQKIRNHLHEMFLYASTRPDVGATVITFVSKLLHSSVSSYDTNINDRWVKIVLELFKPKGIWVGQGEPTEAYNAIRLRATVTALQRASNTLGHNHLEELLAFFDTCISAAAQGIIPDLATTLGSSFAKLVVPHVDRLCPGSWDQPRVLDGKCKQLINHVTQYLAPPTDGAITPLVIAVEYSTRLLKDSPLHLALAADRVGAVLHWLIHEQTALPTSNALQSAFVTLLTKIETNSRPVHRDYNCVQGSVPITPVLDIISHLLDLQLDSLPSLPSNPDGPSTLIGDHEPVPKPSKTKSESYARLSAEIGFEVLKKFPQFVLWRPKCFWRFIDGVIEADRKEPISNPLRLKTVSDIICSAYYQKLTIQQGKQLDTSVYKLGLDEAKRIAALAAKSAHPVFYRSIACHLSIFLGYVSTVRDATDLTYSWRPEYIEILDVWCADEEGSIRKLAWEVDTNSPVTATPYAALATRSGSVGW